MRWKTMGWVALLALLAVAWFVGLRLSGYVLLAWLGLADRVALGGDTYAQYWAARSLPQVAPYAWPIRLSGVAGFVPPIAAWGFALWWYLRWLAARRVAFPTRFASRAELRDAGRRRHELSAIAAMLYDERRYGARSMRETKDAFTAFAGYVCDDMAAQRSLGAMDNEASPTFEAIHRVVSRVSAEGKAAVQKMLGKGFLATDTRAALDTLLRLPDKTFNARLASVEGPLPAFGSTFAATVMSGPGAMAPVRHGTVVSIYLSLGDDLTPDQRRVAAVLLWDLIRFGVRHGSGVTRFTVLLNGIERAGPVQDLPHVLHESAQEGPRFVLRTSQPARWRDIYGARDPIEAMCAVGCRVVGAPSKRADENDFMDMFDFGKDAGRQRPLRFDRSRAVQLRRDLAGLAPDHHLVVAESLAGPAIATTSPLLRDRRLAPRLLPPVTVDPLDLGDPGMPTPTLRAISATAALALAATACSQDTPPLSGQALVEQAKKDGLTVDQERFLQHAMGKPDPNYKWEGYSEKLVPAKLGPNTFMFPMNLYSNQTGPDFQGSVGLMLKWPDLLPYPPGSIASATFRDEMNDNSILINVRYLEHRSARDVVQASIKPRSYEAPDDPRNRIDLRRHGDPVFGLDTYYIDVDRLMSFLREQGSPSGRDRVLELADDWYIRRDSKGEVESLIVCTTGEIRGARLIAGKLENTPVGTSRGACLHTFFLPSSNLLVEIRYLRAFLVDWKRIEDTARDWFNRTLQH